MDKVVELVERVRVYDDGALVLAYARENAVDWGFPEGYDFSLGEAVREALVLNRCNLDDLGMEIIGSEQCVTVED